MIIMADTITGQMIIIVGACLHAEVEEVLVEILEEALLVVEEEALAEVEEVLVEGVIDRL